jgi:N-carbamoyl-L-amino-acid hydrolase
MVERNIRIDGSRLWDSLMAMARIGATEKGGVNRLALTNLDKEARDLFIRWCEEAGCAIRIDKVGNIFARRPGRNGDLAPVITGSHLDSQPTGGKFDGPYGVLAGLEVIRTLNDLEYETERPIEVAVWTNEEGCRFAPGMVASGVFAGLHDLEHALALKDPQGTTFGDELVRIGYAGDSDVAGHEVHAYFEAHIEQGPILEAEDKTIGIVTSAQGQRWYEIILEGVDSHAGTTPMDRRKDAILGAGRIVDLVNRIGLNHAPFACATVGMMEVYPNSRNVIPGRVFLTIDLRHPDPDILGQMDREMRDGAAEIAELGGLTCAIEQVSHYPAVRFADSCIDAVRKAIDECGYSSRDMISGAGHDACCVAAMAPTSMIFIPCIDGISHNEIEDAKPEWITAGADVLLHALLEKANEGEPKSV